MKINNVDYGFFWSVGARIEYDAWIVTHQDAPMSEAIVIQAVAMSKAYNAANGIKGPALKREDIMSLPAQFLDELKDAVLAQVKADSRITVETKPGKRKAAES